MDAVIKEYGEYIIGIITIALVIFIVAGMMGFFDSQTPDGSGNGILGKLICLWLNRIM